MSSLNSTTMLSDPFGAPTPQVVVPSLKFSIGRFRLQSGKLGLQIPLSFQPVVWVGMPSLCGASLKVEYAPWFCRQLLPPA